MNQELGIKGQKGVVGAGLQPAYHDKERKLKLAATIVFFIILNSLFIIPSTVPQAQAQCACNCSGGSGCFSSAAQASATECIDYCNDIPGCTGSCAPPGTGCCVQTGNCVPPTSGTLCAPGFTYNAESCTSTTLQTQCAFGSTGGGCVDDGDCSGTSKCIGGTCTTPTPTPTTAVELPNPLGETDIPTIIGKMIKVFTGGAGSIALLMFIYGGFQWLTAAGNPEKIKKGRDIIVWSILGIIIMFGSYIIANYIISAITGATL